jgi:hypothetical protein
VVQAQLIRRGLLLEYPTPGWNVIGVILNALFGWWWADPLSSLVIVYYGIREGLHAWLGEEE